MPKRFAVGTNLGPSTVRRRKALREAGVLHETTCGTPENCASMRAPMGNRDRLLLEVYQKRRTRGFHPAAVGRKIGMEPIEASDAAIDMERMGLAHRFDTNFVLTDNGCREAVRIMRQHGLLPPAGPLATSPPPGTTQAAEQTRHQATTIVVGNVNCNEGGDQIIASRESFISPPRESVNWLTRSILSRIVAVIGALVVAYFTRKYFH